MNDTKRILMAKRIERAVEEKLRDIEAYDNNEKFNWFDRYTIIIKGHIYTMSDKPDSPMGACIYQGTMLDRDLLNRQNTKISINDLPAGIQSKIDELYNDE